MAFVHRLIQTLLAHDASVATLMPGKPIMITRADGTVPLSNRPLDTMQVRKMVQEVAPEDQMRKLKGREDIVFYYESGDEPVWIGVRWEGDTLEMKVSLRELEEPDAFGGALEHNEPPGFASASSPAAFASAPPAYEPPAPAASSIPDFEPTEAPTTYASGASEAYAGSPLVQAGVDRKYAYSPVGQPAGIDPYLRIMLEEDCSDLHLTSQNPPLYRKDGDITHLRDMPKMRPEQVEALVYEIMPDRNLAEFEETRDTDFAYELPGVGRFRVNVFMDRLGPGAVMRIIPSDILTAEMLNLPKHVMDLCWLNKGLVVVTGPTGSGKSTTLAAIIDFINRNRATHIITIEDPIEFVHPTKRALINQREIGVHTQGFKPALRAALREDPDIVLVGEMRDLETIEIAIETAETGHLVFGTLHTNTAPSTVDRIIDQFPSDRQSQVRTMLSESLRAVIAQTLCKKIGGGRVAALEILMCTHAISNLIREGKTFQIPSMMSTGKRDGMVSLNDSLLALVKNRTIEAKEAYIKSVDKSSFKAQLEREGIRLVM